METDCKGIDFLFVDQRVLESEISNNGGELSFLTPTYFEGKSSVMNCKLFDIYLACAVPT